MKITKDGFCFYFEGARRVIDFDKSNEAPMKKVDLIAEFEGHGGNYDVYVEIKDLTTKELPEKGAEAGSESLDNYYYYLETLKYKYRDTYLYRYAEDKVKKEVYYICLLSLSPKLRYPIYHKFGKDLRHQLSLEPKRKWKWKKKIIDACDVVDERLWKKNWPRWKLERLPETGAEARSSEEPT